jgi:hypothetical protein
MNATIAALRSNRQFQEDTMYNEHHDELAPWVAALLIEFGNLSAERQRYLLSRLPVGDVAALTKEAPTKRRPDH